MAKETSNYYAEPPAAGGGGDCFVLINYGNEMIVLWCGRRDSVVALLAPVL